MDNKYKWLLAALAGTAGLFAGTRMLAHQAVKQIGKILTTDPYHENITEMFSAVYRVGIQNVWEANLRAETGKVINRPLGSPRKMINFDGLAFSPVFLTRLPTPHQVKIDTRTVIGKSCQKPLILSTPIIISGMAYGLALSKEAKMALAKGSAMAGTATNTGEGLWLPEERDLAANLIIQYNRGNWSKDPDILKQADMIEIQLGQGAIAGISHYTPADKLPAEVLPKMRLDKRMDLVIKSYHQEFLEPGGFAKLVDRLRKITGGVPIGIKMAFTNTLEHDIDIAAEAGVDVLALEGTTAATKGAPPIIEDDFGLPTIIGLCRAVEYLEKRGLKDKISLIVSGGFFTPGDMLKALALGANAVYIGSIALFAMSHTQSFEALPFEPPTQIVWQTGKYRTRFNWKKGAVSLAKFITSCTLEMAEGVRALGKTAISQVDRSDLIALDETTAAVTGVPAAWHRIPQSDHPGNSQRSESASAAPASPAKDKP